MFCFLVWTFNRVLNEKKNRQTISLKNMLLRFWQTATDFVEIGVGRNTVGPRYESKFYYKYGTYSHLYSHWSHIKSVVVLLSGVKEQYRENLSSNVTFRFQYLFRVLAFRQTWPENRKRILTIQPSHAILEGSYSWNILEYQNHTHTSPIDKWLYCSFWYSQF